jgi:hypothetical protein
MTLLGKQLWTSMDEDSLPIDGISYQGRTVPSAVDWPITDNYEPAVSQKLIQDLHIS